jgi:hypothetical protein
MVYAKTMQPAFLFAETTRFPSTRYQGSKAKLADWIWQQIAPLDFETCLDAFGGTGSIAYRLKQADQTVAYTRLCTFLALWPQMGSDKAKVAGLAPLPGPSPALRGRRRRLGDGGWGS